MDNVEISPHFKATSVCVPSLTASHVASLAGSKLHVRCLTTFQPTRVISLPSSFDTKNPRIAWSPPTSIPVEQSSTSTPPRRTSHRNRLHSNRILIADDDTTRVYDLRDDKWSAVISNGSGGMGKNIHVEFGATEEEVLVWSDFAACLKIWCLHSGRAVEVRDPKFSGRDGRGWGFRPRPLDTERAGRGDVLALLCRSSGLDVLILLAAGSYSLISRVELPTADAVGVKWSLDGRWLAVWDAASTGFKMHIYTADGHLYRTITKEPSEETDAWGIEGLGIKTVEWIPGNEKLAIGGWDKRIRILSTRTFAPLVFLDHTPVINVPSAPVYTEHVDGQGNRSYAITPQPFTPPKAPTEKNETGLMKTGIGMMTFNMDGTLCATRDDSSPSTVWVWDLKSLKPRCIIVQYAPVKSLLWHPYDAGKLLVHTALDKGVVYVYTTQSLSSSTSSSITQESPMIIDLSTHIPKPTSSAPILTKWHTSWLATQPDKKPLLVLGNQAGSILVWPDGKDQILRFEHEEESDDSLYEILTGKKSVPRVLDVETDLARDDGSFDASVGLDDTFREKRGRGFEKQGLGESGLDEMF